MELMKKNIVKKIILFILAFGIMSLIMTQIITMERYVLNIFFLSIIAFGIIFYFKKDFIEIINKTSKREFIFLLAISLIIHFISSYFILNFLNQPIWPFSSKGASILLMNNFYLWVKPLNVLVQQLLIIVLVKKLSQSNLNVKQITTLFILGFGLIHVFQIFKTDLIIGLGFMFIAIFFSFIFPYLILKKRNGYLYNYMFHLGTYNLAAILAWTLF